MMYFLYVCQCVNTYDDNHKIKYDLMCHKILDTSANLCS